jgi:hypothetical protein
VVGIEQEFEPVGVERLDFRTEETPDEGVFIAQLILEPGFHLRFS